MTSGPPDEGLREPLGRALHRALRRAVLDHAVSERRRHHPLRVHVGVPGAGPVVYAEPSAGSQDLALRADVLAAMVRRSGCRSPIVWLTRTGELDLQDRDAAWLAGARAAYAEVGLPLVFVVANRHGWRDPRSGLTRTWVRLRPR